MKDILQLYKQSFPYIRDANLLFQYGSRMDVNVTFHEDITGKIATAQGSVSFHQVDVKLKFAEFNPSYYKPGLPYQALVGEFFMYRVQCSFEISCLGEHLLFVIVIMPLRIIFVEHL